MKALWGFRPRLGTRQRFCPAKPRYLRRLHCELLEQRALLAGLISFVDANNDSLFNAGDGDVELTTEVSDGHFDTRHTEGAYTTVIPGAGLVIGGAAISGHDLTYRAEGNVVVDTNLTANHDVNLTSRFQNVELADPVVTGGHDVTITAAVDIVAANNSIEANHNVELIADGNVDVNGSTVRAGHTVEVQSVVGVIRGGFATIQATDANGKIKLKVGSGIVDMSNSIIEALGDEGQIEMEADDQVETILGTIFVVDSIVRAGKSINLDSAGSVAAFSSPFSPYRTRLEVLAGNIDIEARYFINASKAVFNAMGGDGQVNLQAGMDIDLTGIRVHADKEIDVRSHETIFARYAELLSCLGRVEVEAGRRIDLSTSTIRAFKEIHIESLLGEVDVSLASIAIAEGSTKGDIEVKGITIQVKSATILAPDDIDLDGFLLGTATVIGTGTLEC